MWLTQGGNLLHTNFGIFFARSKISKLWNALQLQHTVNRDTDSKVQSPVRMVGSAPWKKGEIYLQPIKSSVRVNNLVAHGFFRAKEKKSMNRIYPLALVSQNIVDFWRVNSLLGTILHLTFFSLSAFDSIKVYNWEFLRSKNLYVGNEMTKMKNK